MNYRLCVGLLLLLPFLGACAPRPTTPGALVPRVVTEPTKFDTDDPAIWINPADATKSLIVGTDKETGGRATARSLRLSAASLARRPAISANIA